MGERRSTRDCQVPGCTVTLAKYHPFGKFHEAMEHQRCLCGWVGTSVTKHIAQQIRFDPDRAGEIRLGHAFVGTVSLEDTTT